MLTGQLPWQKADLTDPNYAEYINWRKRRTLRTPKRLTNFSSRVLRMFKRLLEPKPEKRASAREVYKYMDDKWLVRLPRRDVGDVDGQSVCYSTFSMHSCPKEKDRVLRTLKAHGIETTVDRIAKRQRIHEWLERSLSSRNLGHDEERAKEEHPKSTHNRKSDPSLPGRVAVMYPSSQPQQTRTLEETRKQYQELAAMTMKVAQSRVAKQYPDANANIPQHTKPRNSQEYQEPPALPSTPTTKTTPVQDIISKHSSQSNGSPPRPALRTSRRRSGGEGKSHSPHLSRHAQSPVRSPTEGEPRDSHGPRHNRRQVYSPSPTRAGKHGRRKLSRGYELQRSKTDSYFVTGTTRSPPSRQTSQDSDSSDTSLISIQPVVLR